MNLDELREYAADYWRGIDVDKYQPIPHGPPRTAEDLEHARKQLEIVEQLLQQREEDKICKAQGSSSLAEEY